MNEDSTNRRRDWQLLQQRISDAFIRLYRENQRQPTNIELAKNIGVSERTIVRHLKTIDFSGYFEKQRIAFAPMMSNVMIAIYNSAIKGKVPAQKLMLQIVFNWAEPKSYETPEKSTEQATEEELADIERGIELLLNMRQRQKEYDTKYAKSD